jgi:hypothetical protein
MRRPTLTLTAVRKIRDIVQSIFLKRGRKEDAGQGGPLRYVDASGNDRNHHHLGGFTPLSKEHGNIICEYEYVHSSQL